jgi:glycerophosphoryl diester phosphodiesterase
MQKSLSELKTAKRPLVIAHRGYRTKYPENTLVAFQAAIDVGADMIELDVLLTKDRKMVVIHDESLGRTTNGRGMVSDCTLSQLKALDAGSWFDPCFKEERFRRWKRFWMRWPDVCRSISKSRGVPMSRTILLMRSKNRSSSW